VAVTEQLTQTGWVLLCLVAAAEAGAFVLAMWKPASGRISSWAQRHGVRVTEANRPVIARYLRRTRGLQIAGAAVGWMASPLYAAATGRMFPLGDNWVALAVGGFLLGAVVAEAVTARAPRAPLAVRAAALIPRSLPDYLAAPSLWALRILPVAVLGVAVAYAAVPKDPTRIADPTVAYFAVVSVVLVGFAVAIEWTLRAIVLRPQQLAGADMVAADDAIRASSLRALSAGAVALLLLGVGWGLASIGIATSLVPLRNVATSIGAVTDLVAVLAWVGLTHPRSWRVRHETPLDPAG
jgi:hypothetical protein